MTKSVSSKSTISTTVSTTSFSTSGSLGLKSPSHARSSRKLFGGVPSPTISKKNIVTTVAIAEQRSPTEDHIMARVVHDRSGAFPTPMPSMTNITSPQQQSSYRKGHSSVGGGSSAPGSPGGGAQPSSALPQSPRRTYTHPPQIPSSPSTHLNHRQQVNLTPKLRSGGGAPSSSSGASVASNGSGGIARTQSRENFSSGNTVASNGSGSNGERGGRSTPTRQHHHHSHGRTRPPLHVEDEKKMMDSYGDDNATYMSHHTNGTHSSNGSGWNPHHHGGNNGRFVSTPSNSVAPNNMGGNSSVATGGASVASNSSGPRFAPSVAGERSVNGGGSGNTRHGVDMSLHDSVKQKGIAKRKRKEYAKDPRYTPVRRVVDELNKAIGPEKRRSAIERACIEFDHPNDLQHNAELYLGAANVLCLVLSMSDQEEEIMSICSALEMVYRGEREAVIISYQDVGAALVPLLLRLLERCEKGRKVISASAEATIGNISRILLHMTRISELRVPLVGHPGMLAALERVATLPLSMENRILRMRLLANLANSEGNKVTIFERSSLMEATMKVATLDKAENAREYASAVLMDLSSCPPNQVAMVQMDKVLATLVKLAVVEDKVETREYAVSGLQNLAFEKQNRMQLVSYGSGVVIEALKKCTSSDSNDKTRRRSAGALTNLACDDTAQKMANHAGLFQTLATASVSDKNKDVQQRATLALTKLANSISVKMSCWNTLLDALITASQCTVADGIVSAMFRVKTRAEENRTSMANHPRLLETLAQLCLRTKDCDDKKAAYKDCENATKAIAHLANDPNNHKLICNKHILAALVHGASLAGPAGVVTRDAAILAMERMAMEHSNRPMMARYPGMLVSIAQATEREMNEELNGIPASSVTGQPRLAKPLLMSLLVAM
mmetsp:Transcript_5738/g.13038  ORF Transcript_5738/g.13038 Transcript_5738/m.13038 type:complete len:900 (-) Transcript_5738:273-2972(-)